MTEAPRETTNYLFHLEWGVYSHGYEIVEPNAPKGYNKRNKLLGLSTQYRFDRSIKAIKRTGYTIYNPFIDYPDMARKFSKIRIRSGMANEQDVLMFTTKYGLLGLNNSRGTKEESLKDWCNAIVPFKYVFDCIENGSEQDALYYYNGIDNSPEMTVKIPWDTARYFMLEPNSLLGAMWLMLGKEISLGAQYRICEREGCPEVFRKWGKRRFCSNACKQSDYRSKLSK